MELSSFQLELMTHSPQVAAVLNVTPNHLDRHHSMEAYIAAKARILTFQTEDDFAVLGSEAAGAWALRSEVRGRLISFGRSLPEDMDGAYVDQYEIRLRLEGEHTAVCPLSMVELRGEHNLLNVLAACSLAGVVGISSKKMVEGIRGFVGVEHRLEFVRQVRGADWYNDSIATSPERAIAAIQSFDEPLVLLAGGRDKDLPWDSFAELVRARVDHLVLFGEAVEKIARAIEATAIGKGPESIHKCAGLAEAVAKAAWVAEAGDVVLLAPGGTSFDEFKDFAERGEQFRQWVMSL
jgi:UDP-N-acetylmuramoylalanine--D-glutamate ligase